MRLTNLATDEAITLNLSGPGRVTFHPDGSITFVNGGFGLIVVFPTDIPAGPRTILTAGRLVQTLTATGQLIVVSLAGRQEDVCRALLGATLTHTDATDVSPATGPPNRRSRNELSSALR